MDQFSLAPVIIALGMALVFLVLLLSLASQARTPAAGEASEPSRFLCPACLHFGVFRHACSGCGSSIDALVVNTRGHLASTCTVCNRRLFRGGSPTGGGHLATCQRCGEACEPALYHERRLHLVGTLFRADFEELRGGAEPKWVVRENHALCDTGKELVYVLDLSAFGSVPGIPDPQHAQANLNALWIGSSLGEPLLLGEALDRLIRWSAGGVGPDHLRVLVGTRETTSPGANVLDARFPRAEYGVAPKNLPRILREGARRDRQADANRQPLALAVLTEDDLARLASVTDLEGRRILNRSGLGRSPRHGPIRVACVERISRAQAGSGPDPLGTPSAVWIADGPRQPDVLEAQIQQLFRGLGLAQSRAENLLVCLEDPHPHAAVRTLLESRFGRIAIGVPPQEFLARGPEAQGWTLTGHAPVQSLAVLNATDQWILGEAMESEHRHDLGGGWLCEASPSRVNYILNLDAPDRTPGSFFATPDPGEIQAVWIHLAGREPLGLAEYLDRMDRIPGLRTGEREGVIACVYPAELAPAIRNVLEARFEQIYCGVSAEEFLTGHHAGKSSQITRRPPISSSEQTSANSLPPEAAGLNAEG